MICRSKLGSIWLPETKNGKLIVDTIRSESGLQRKIRGWNFSINLNTGVFSFWKFPKDETEDYLHEIESVVIPTRVVNSKQGRMAFSKQTGALYIVTGYETWGTTDCYLLYDKMVPGWFGEIRPLSFESLDFAPKGFQFELKNTFFKKKEENDVEIDPK